MNILRNVQSSHGAGHAAPGRGEALRETALDGRRVKEGPGSVLRSMESIDGLLEGAGGLVCRYHTCYLISRVMCGVSKWAISGVSYVDMPYLDPDLSK